MQRNHLRVWKYTFRKSWIFGTKNRKVKCSKCYFVWTVNPLGKAIEVPPLYESIESQGGIIKENKEEALDPNIKPDHPLPVPVKDNTNEKGGILSDAKRKEYFEKPSETRKKKLFAAKKRLNKKKRRFK